MAFSQVMRAAKDAKEKLLSEGHKVEAQAIQRLLVSRSASQTLNGVLHTDLARVRSCLRRAHDAMSRRDPDGISETAWDEIVADMAKELGVANG